MNRINELGSNLQRLLSGLKKNRNSVPREVLRTQYHNAYYQLIAQVSEAAQLFVKYVVGHRLLINPYIPIEEQLAVVQHIIDTSTLLAEMRRCISQTYDVEELYSLALRLRAEIELALWPYINMETCYLLDMENPKKEPVLYNILKRQVYENGRWIEQDIDLSRKLIIYISKRPYDKELSANSSQERTAYEE